MRHSLRTVEAWLLAIEAGLLIILTLSTPVGRVPLTLRIGWVLFFCVASALAVAAARHARRGGGSTWGWFIAQCALLLIGAIALMARSGGWL